MKVFFKRPRDFIKRNSKTIELIALTVVITILLTEVCYANLEEKTTQIHRLLEGSVAKVLLFGGLLFGGLKGLFSNNMMLLFGSIGCLILFAIGQGIINSGFNLFGAVAAAAQ